MTPDEKIIKSRILLKNPYAYIDELLHLSSFTRNVEPMENNKLMGNPYASLGALNEGLNRSKKAGIKNSELTPRIQTMQDPYAFVPGNTVKLSKFALMGNPYARINEVSTENRPSVSRFEKLARDIQTTLWQCRNEFWPDGVPTDPVDLLDLSVAFRSIGYEYEIRESLDDCSKGAKFKIAGLIDQTNKKAFISNQFSPEIQRFTSAHELGHALMHKGSGLHRDRALDGSPVKGKKDKIEIEADKFATFFLMPRNLVINRFKQAFGTDTFILDEATIFALDPSNELNLMVKKNDLRYISRILAKTQHYNDQHFDSLSEQFRVSVETMAIRLEELNLINI